MAVAAADRAVERQAAFVEKAPAQGGLLLRERIVRGVLIGRYRRGLPDAVSDNIIVAATYTSTVTAAESSSLIAIRMNGSGYHPGGAGRARRCTQPARGF